MSENREKEGNFPLILHTSLETTTSIVIQNVIATIDDPEGVIDERFITVCKDVLTVINTERAKQGRDHYDANRVTILVYEFYRTALKYLNKAPRKDGKNVFYSHLIGALYCLVQEQGETDITPVLAILKHDWVEDFVDKNASAERKRVKEVELYDELVRPDLYRNMIISYNDDIAAKIVSDVRSIVKGVTKLRRNKRKNESEGAPEEDRKATREATFVRYLRVAKGNPQVVSVKCADRRHNVKTIEGHGSDEKGLRKQLNIMRETEQIYLSIARVFRLRETVRLLVDDCVNFLNPELREDFEEFLRKRLDDRISEYGVEILARLDKDRFRKMGSQDLIVDVEIVPRGLDFYTAGLNILFEELTLEDLPIGKIDPMFEIVVLTKPVDGWRRNNGDYEQAAWKSITEVKSFVDGQFSSGSGSSLKANTPARGDIERMLGLSMTIFSKDFGGKLCFRVNDHVLEAKSKRGYLASSHDTPRELQTMIQAVLDKGTARYSGVTTKSTLIAARQELMKPRIRALTLKGDAKDLPDGATGLDFASAVHGDLLLGLQKFYVQDDVHSSSREREIFPFDRIDGGKVYIVDSCLSGENFDRSKIQVDPLWLLFAQSDTRVRIKRYLRSLGPEANLEMGEAYLGRLAKIFEIKFEDLVGLIEGRFPKRRDDNGILRGVGEGDLNPLAVISRYVEGEEKKAHRYLDETAKEISEGGEAIERVKSAYGIWKIEAMLPDEPRALRDFTKEISEELNINIERFLEHIPPRPGERNAKITLVLNIYDAHISIYDFFRMLVKLDAKGSIRIVGGVKDRFVKRKKRRNRKK